AGPPTTHALGGADQSERTAAPQTSYVYAYQPVWQAGQTGTKLLATYLALLPRPQHEALAAARARETTDEGRRLYAQRQGVESTISQAVRAFGLRQARY